MRDNTYICDDHGWICSFLGGWLSCLLLMWVIFFHYCMPWLKKTLNGWVLIHPWPERNDMLSQTKQTYVSQNKKQRVIEMESHSGSVQCMAATVIISPSMNWYSPHFTHRRRFQLLHFFFWLNFGLRLSCLSLIDAGITGRLCHMWLTVVKFE